MSGIFPRAFDRCRRSVLTAWLLLAAVNLAAAVVITTWPERRADLETIQRWGGDWLLRGDDIYATDWDYPDYPPHAIALLSPLGTMSLEMAVRVWSFVNLFLVVLAPYLALRHVRPNIPASQAVLPILMFLCWSGSRTLLQFSLLALTCGLAATVLADRRPVWSGIWLGVALMKPQIAVPFVVWAVIARRWRVLSMAFIVVVAGFGVYCARAAASPVAVTAHYVAILQYLYTGEAIMLGLAQLRAGFELLAVSPSAVDLMTLAAAAMLFTLLCGVAWAERRLDHRSTLAAPAMVALWSLLTFYHLTYGFLLLLPLAAYLLLAEIPGAQVFRRRLFWVLQLGMMFDVPGWSRRLVPLLSLPAWIDVVLRHFDRVLVLGLFVATCLLALKTARLAQERRSQPINAVSEVVT